MAEIIIHDDDVIRFRSEDGERRTFTGKRAIHAMQNDLYSDQPTLIAGAKVYTYLAESGEVVNIYGSSIIEILRRDLAFAKGEAFVVNSVARKADEVREALALYDAIRDLTS